jgi:hypothetical protein
MAVQVVARSKPVGEQVSAAEWTARVELAAGHRVLAHYGVNHHFLEMACRGQVAALAAGQGNYTIPSKGACEYAHSQFMAAGRFLKGGKDWAACLRLADRLDPAYKE